MPGRRYYFVYLLTNSRRTVLYTGVTRDLRRRIAQHRLGAVAGFSRKYQVHRLVWYEVHENPRTAIEREKRIKGGPRWRKEALIRGFNPEWKDLSLGL